jgi:hypothetical protein
MSVVQFGILGTAVGVVWFTVIALIAIWVQRRENAQHAATA